MCLDSKHIREGGTRTMFTIAFNILKHFPVFITIGHLASKGLHAFGTDNYDTVSINKAVFVKLAKYKL